MQKAFCKDYDRLKDSLGDLATKLRTVPTPTDGGATDDPPSVEPGDFTLEQDPMPIPGMQRFGILRIGDGSPVSYYILADGYGGSDPDAEGAVAVVYGFIMADYEHFVKDSILLPTQAVTYAVWDEAATEIERLRAGIVSFQEWASEVGEGADNSETRDALAECVRRLDELETAFGETVRKWREH